MHQPLKRTLTFAALVIAMLIVPKQPAGLAHAQSGPRKVDVTVKRFGFEPNEITLKKGEPATITIKSTDVAHGLRFRELALETKVPAGGSSELKFTPDKTGDFTGHCSVFCGSGHGGMTLTIHVVE